MIVSEEEPCQKKASIDGLVSSPLLSELSITFANFSGDVNGELKIIDIGDDCFKVQATSERFNGLCMSNVCLVSFLKQLTTLIWADEGTSPSEPVVSAEYANTPFKWNPFIPSDCEEVAKIFGERYDKR